MDSTLKDVEYLFPPNTKIMQFSGSSDKYTALLRCKCRTKEEFRQQWLTQYEKLSRVTMRVLLTRPKMGKTVVYKAAFRCQHNTYPASHQRVKVPHRKHTGCPAILKVTIKASPENRRVRSVDVLRKDYPTIISINHDHNHKLPNQGLLNSQFLVNQQKSVEIYQNLNCEMVKSSWIEEEYEKQNELQMGLDWDFLKECWSSFLEKWESSNSVHLYNSLLKATSCLENCKTVNATIAVLNSVGKKSVKKFNSKVLIQSRSMPNTKSHCNGPNGEKQGLPIKLEVSNPVDELLVIDQGWIF